MSIVQNISGMSIILLKPKANNIIPSDLVLFYRNPNTKSAITHIMQYTPKCEKYHTLGRNMGKNVQNITKIGQKRAKKGLTGAK